jgi:hypothetical protein
MITAMTTGTTITTTAIHMIMPTTMSMPTGTPITTTAIHMITPMTMGTTITTMGRREQPFPRIRKFWR